MFYGPDSHRSQLACRQPARAISEGDRIIQIFFAALHMSALMALAGRPPASFNVRPSGLKRTSPNDPLMSAYAPQRTSAPLSGCKMPAIPADWSSPIRYPAIRPWPTGTECTSIN